MEGIRSLVALVKLFELRYPTSNKGPGPFFVHLNGTESFMENEFGDDLLRGVKQIANFIREDERSTYHKLSRGYLPGGKEGSEWVASKRVLREHYARLTGAKAAEATDKRVA